jgi:hypothetical protein
MSLSHSMLIAVRKSAACLEDVLQSWYVSYEQFLIAPLSFADFDLRIVVTTMLIRAVSS